ncbi:RICIN domain-containing protein [Nocardia puris]|uniref:RICIN domain-containing protein n=1 Tax=Nocardia puris TaxID=208602 RepID=UPI002E1DC29E
MRATVMVSAAAIVLLTGGTALASPTPVTLRGEISGKCLDVYGGGSESHRQIVQFGCSDDRSQRFIIKKASEDTVVVLTFAGKCWHLKDRSTADGTHVIQWECNVPRSQTFAMRQEGSAAAVFTHPASGKCLGIPNADTSHSAPLVLLPCDAPGVQGFIVR